MELSPKQQASSLIQNAQKILLLTHKNPDADAIGSTLGFAIVLGRLKKEVSAVCSSPVPETLAFLPFSSIIKQESNSQNELVINLNCSRASVERLGYRIENNILSIVVSSKQGRFTEEDVSVVANHPNFDLVIVLDTPNLERLGIFYDQNPGLFFKTPLINIDHHPTNEYFGKVNLVDLTATSTSEILISVIEALSKEEKLINEQVANCLLTGIIGDTASFQNNNTTPKSLTCAAQLLAAGANQQEIVHRLFKTKSLSTLKLWGRALEHIQEEPQFRFAYSKITKEDFQKTAASEEELTGVIDELLKSISSCDLVMLLSERKEGIAGSLRAIEPSVDCTEIAKAFEGGGHRGAAAFLVTTGNLQEVEETALAKIREYQKKRLGIV